MAEDQLGAMVVGGIGGHLYINLLAILATVSCLEVLATVLDRSQDLQEPWLFELVVPVPYVEVFHLVRRVTVHGSKARIGTVDAAIITEDDDGIAVQLEEDTPQGSLVPVGGFLLVTCGAHQISRDVTSRNIGQCMLVEQVQDEEPLWTSRGQTARIRSRRKAILRLKTLARH